ncbi:MAG: exodeoxyribonuclease V subunit gamma [Chloroflexales bacterium]|nr:exodeoxyribonuclease V subunit gamma [Chloroflexales bacterium]
MNSPGRCHVLIGPAASGKTATALDALRALNGAHGLLLVPSRLQQHHLKARLADVSRVGVYQFYRLARLILRRARIQVDDINDTARVMLIRATLRELAAEDCLPCFARVAHKPGFIAMISDILAEAQQAELTPQALAAAEITPYDAELGTIYAAYLAAQERLGLADAAQRLALARNALRSNPRLFSAIALLVVDGFDQVTPLQLSLLAGLAQQVQRSLITLTGANTERLAHRRFRRTLAQLQSRLALAASDISVVQPLSAPFPAPVPVLAYIEQRLFNLDVPAPIVAAGALAVIEAADREREVRAALRQVRRLLSAGVVPEQVALIFREGAAYVPLLREIAAEYGLPLALYTGLPLAEAPQALTLQTLLRLPLDDYPRRALVETWRTISSLQVEYDGLSRADQPEAELLPSPQSTTLDLAQSASMLDQVARSAGIAAGLERFRRQLQLLTEAEPPSAEEDDWGATVSPVAAADLLRLLDAFVVLLMPPERATMAEYVAWTKQKLTDCNPVLSVLQSGDATLQTDVSLDDDIHSTIRALKRVEAVLDDLAQAATLVDAAPIRYSAFVAELSAALATARYARDEPGAGRVAVFPVLAARGLYFDHVVLLGMADGEFPLRLPEPLFYSRRERMLLAGRGIALPPPDPADERSLFYEAITRARRSLTLTRTYLDESGNPLPRSPYLAALLDLVGAESVPVQRIRAGSIPALTEAASPQEALIGFMEGEVTTGANKISHEAIRDVRLLQHVRHACAVERVREATGAYGPFDGRIDDAALATELAQHFGAQYRWSVTRLNDYITCPFRFFAAHVLSLARYSDPEEGLDRAGRGRVYHKILAEAGKRWRLMEQPYSADHAPAILDALQSAADTILADAPQRFVFEPGQFWDWEQADIRRRLTRALRRVLQEGDDWAGFKPAGIEQGFGLRAGQAPLRLTTSLGTVLVVGRVDRVDQREDKALALLDYKSGATPRRFEETLQGRDVQLAIYLLATEQLLAPGQRVERAAFLHLSSGKRSRAVTDKERDQVLAAMTKRVAETVQGVRDGDFAVRPRDECPPNCTFQHICRLNLRKRDAQATDEY